MSNDTSEPNKPAAEPAPSVPRAPWNPWLGTLFVIFIFFGTQLFAGLIISLYPLLKHWSHGQAVAWIEHSVGAQFAYILMAEGLIIAAIIFFLRLYKSDLTMIGLRRPRWIDAAYGLAALPLYFLLYVLSVAIAKYLAPGLDINQPQQLGFNDVVGGGALTLTFISLVALPAFAEEIMVRGLLYSSLKKALKIIPAALLTSLIFAAAHLPEGGAAGPLYIAALDTFILSLVLIYLREKTGSLWSCITLHALKNGIAFTILFAFHLR